MANATGESHLNGNADVAARFMAGRDGITAPQQTPSQQQQVAGVASASSPTGGVSLHPPPQQQQINQNGTDGTTAEAPVVRRYFITEPNAKGFSENYALGQVIGRGASATVYNCTHKTTGEELAVKVIDKQNVNRRVDALQNEVKILKSVSHPHILSLKELYEDDVCLYLVTALMRGGELFDRIQTLFPDGYSEKNAAAIVRKIISAVDYLHSKGIIHRDLKPENLLFASANADATDIQIADFGFAKVLTHSTLMRTACGSPNYVAPEVLLRDRNGYSFAADMWSVGVIAYVLLCGFCPFYDESTPRLFQLIIAGTYCFPSPYWDNISADAKDFVQQLLVTDPARRLTAQQALQHKWLVGENQSGEVIQNVTETLRVSQALHRQQQLQQ